MDYCVCIQCFNKPIETLLVLDSLETNNNLKNIHLLLYVDKSNDNTRSFNKNKEFIFFSSLYMDTDTKLINLKNFF